MVRPPHVMGPTILCEKGVRMESFLLLKEYRFMKMELPMGTELVQGLRERRPVSSPQQGSVDQCLHRYEATSVGTFHMLPLYRAVEAKQQQQQQQQQEQEVQQQQQQAQDLTGGMKRNALDPPVAAAAPWLSAAPVPSGVQFRSSSSNGSRINSNRSSNDRMLTTVHDLRFLETVLRHREISAAPAYAEAAAVETKAEDASAAASGRGRVVVLLLNRPFPSYVHCLLENASLVVAADGAANHMLPLYRAVEAKQQQQQQQQEQEVQQQQQQAQDLPGGMKRNALDHPVAAAAPWLSAAPLPSGVRTLKSAASAGLTWGDEKKCPRPPRRCSGSLVVCSSPAFRRTYAKIARLYMRRFGFFYHGGAQQKYLGPLIRFLSAAILFVEDVYICYT
ncbi:uncharacterized protein EMH_0069880 [Eimeria mitis]|uniref:Uncharacterized protein n=1 Tax=Eimeria mitis TaxID=44415 RepID=U6K256_9EIME|nr:uncharacterized protein EMH_0069880 [Eimeria mitis]CDJ31804.1 hypothetical protein EMH_0069880 [Eimeria mitis]